MADLPYLAEYAKSGRASCKGCKNKIDQGALRIAAMIQSAFFDGKQAYWYHEECFFQKQRPQTSDEIAKFNVLRNPDQKRIKETIESCGSGIVMPEEKGKGKGKSKGKGVKRANGDANQAALRNFAVEYSKSSRATCKVCELKIIKGEVRVCKIVFDTEVGQKFGGQPLWHHVKCFAEDRTALLYMAGGEDLPGFNTLSKEDKAMVKSEIKPLKSDEVPLKKLKAEPKDEDDVKKEAELEKKLETQTKLFFKYRDALRDWNKQDLHGLLEANDLEIPTGTDNCLDLLADSIAFGTLAKCSKCKGGQLKLDTNGYICKGDLSEWTKCQFVTQTPKRVPFKVPARYKAVAPFSKSFKGKVLERIFKSAPKPSTLLIKKEEVLEQPKKKERPIPSLKNLEFYLYGKLKSPKEEIKNRILKLGGIIKRELTDTIAAVISTKKDVERMPMLMEQAQERYIEVVEESYLDLIEAEKGNIAKSLQLIKENNIACWGDDPVVRIPQDVLDGKSIPKSGSMYVKSEKSGIKKLKLQGGTAVDPDSGLTDEAHVYKDQENTKWTVVLGLTDVVAQKNSYYKLQVLEADNKKKYWLFRSWGRIGTSIGGNKTESCKSIDDATHKFEELYFDKTENPWECRDNFMKVPGKMYPIDVDYGVDDQVAVLKEDPNCKLPVSVQKLILNIFDINSMKKVLLEYELDTEKMPLGKLSKKQVTAAFKVLTELLKVMEKSQKSGNISEDKIIDATNRFYTLVPHNFGLANPPLLNNVDLIKKKTEMLDNLLEIEIAYSLLKIESEDSSHSPIESHYLKLKAEIVPLDKTAPEYALLTSYVKNTHAATHSQYTLEILEIFKVVRDGEDKRYKPFKKLPNRKLLWHGSRVTNFAGILSQGLRIAPPEAPVTGYMFGKGIYFADMVSKSANYCCTNKSNPVGVILACEVALGNMKECLQAEYVTKLPPGKHSVVGLGRTHPDPKLNITLEDGIEVPLGQPVERKIDSSLLYNEYIVYDVAQVNVKYLFQMKFNFTY